MHWWSRDSIELKSSVHPGLESRAKLQPGPGGTELRSPGLGTGFSPGSHIPFRQLLASQLFDEFSVLGINRGEFRSLRQLEIREVETWRHGATYERKPGGIFQPGGKPTSRLHDRLKNFTGLEGTP